MTERDENGLTRAAREARDKLNAEITDAALENTQRDLASQGVYKSIDDILKERAMRFYFDIVEKEDE